MIAISMICCLLSLIVQVWIERLKNLNWEWERNSKQRKDHDQSHQGWDHRSYLRKSITQSNNKTSFWGSQYRESKRNSNSHKYGA